MRVAVYDYMSKAAGVTAALAAHGWEIVPFGADADVALVDRDMHYLHDHAHRYDRIVLYPHGGNPTAVCLWDGLYEPFPVDCLLVHGPGQAEVLRRYGYPHRVEVVGYTYCEQQDFEGAGDRVLFAPNHGLYPEDHAANQAALGRLRDLFGDRFTVRDRRPFDNLDAVAQIDEYDLVVADGTFLSLAVARGNAAVTFGQAGVSQDDYPDGVRRAHAHAGEYVEFIRYPYELETLDWTAPVPEAVAWREAFIGPHFNHSEFNDLMTEICGG